jgi:hypothetical protein
MINVIKMIKKYLVCGACMNKYTTGGNRRTFFRTSFVREGAEGVVPYFPAGGSVIIKYFRLSCSSGV